MSEINPVIFREYDIRGVYPDEFDEDAAYKIAAAFCQYLEQKKHFGPVVVGYDARISSPSLANAFKQGVLDQGRDALDLGMVTTPLFYFAFNSAKAAGGAMITASHNSGDLNGIKLIREGGVSVYGKDGLPEVRKFVGDGVGIKMGKGRLVQKEFVSDYVDYLKIYAEVSRPLRVVADASNGSAGPVLEKFFGGLKNVAVEKIFFSASGDFTEHSPNPLSEKALDFAVKKVIETKADLGFVLDADGDRIIFIDEKGDYMPADLMYAFLLDNLLERGDLVLADVSMSKVIEDVCRKKDAVFERAPVGHANVKAMMRAKEARFAGELSGHFYFKDFFYSDSALLALSHVLSLASKTDEPLSKIIEPYKKYFNSGQLNFSVKNPEEVIERLKKEYADGRQSFLDGLTVEYQDWWFNVRASKTEPLVRLVVEAESRELMEEKIKELTEKI